MARKKSIPTDDSLRNQAEDQLSKMDGLVQQSLINGDELKLFHELQLHQIELEMQNEELLTAQSNLEQYQKKYREFLDFAPNSYFTLNQSGLIQEVNLTGASLLGICRSALIDNSFARFIYPEEVNIYNTYWNKLIETRDHQVCELRISGHGGRQLITRLDMSLTESHANLQVFIVITDITLPKKIEETQSFLMECSLAKAGKDFFELLAEHIAKSISMDYVSILKICENEIEADSLVTYFDGEYLEKERFKLQDTPYEHISDKKVIFFLNKVRHRFPNDIVLQNMIAESFVGISIRSNDGKPIGLIAVIGRKPLIEAKLAEMLLRQISISVAGEMEHQQVEKKLWEHDFLLKSQRAASIGSYMTDFASGIWESSEVLDEILGIECGFKRSKQGWLDLVHPEDKEMVNQHLRIEVIDQKRDFNIEYRIIRKSDNETRWVHDLGRPDFDVTGNPVSLVGTVQDITERKLHQDALRIKREQLQSIIDNSQDLIYRYDIQKSCYVLFSPNLMEAYGYSIAQMDSIKHDLIMDQIHPDDSTTVESELAQINISGRGILEFRRLSQYNKVNWLSVTISVIYDANGKPKYRDVTIKDITQNKQAEEALKKSEEQFSKAFYSSLLGINIFSLKDGKCLLANQAFISLLGYAEEEVIGHSAEELDLGISREEKLYWMNTLTAGSIIENREIKIRQKSGKTLFVLFSLTTIEMNGEIMGIIQTINNTESKRAEELNKMYNTIMKFARDPILVIDDEGNIIEGNIAAIEYYGYAYDELLKLKIYDLRASKDRNITNTQMKKAFAEGILFETYHKHKDGSFSPVEVSSMGVTIDGKAVLLKVIRDITERKKNEELLRESENRIRLALTNAPISIAAQDKNLRYIWAYNQRSIDPIDFIGKTDHELFPENAEQLIAAKMQVLKTGTHHQTELWVRSNGQLQYLNIYIEPLNDEDGNIIGVGIATFDLTPMKKAEMALQESEKKFFTIYEKSPYAISLSEIKTGTIIHVNEAFVKLSGYRKEEIIGKTSSNLNLFVKRNRRKDLIHEIAQNGFAHNLEDAFYTRLGKTLIIQYNIDVIEINQQKFLLSTVQDITEQRKAQNALRENEANMDAILNVASESIWLFDTNGKVLMGNNIAIKRLGIPAEDIIGIHLKKLISKELGDTRLKKLKEAAYTKLPVKLIDQRAGNYFEHTFYPVINSEGNVERVAAFSRDISQQLKEEQTQKRLNRTLAALARSSQAILKSTNEKSYLQEVCNIVREDCGFEMVWIGFAENNEFKSIRPVASAGFDKHSLELAKISWDNNEHGQGPTGTAIRTGKRSICTDMLNDPKLLPWRNEAIKRGYNSTIAFPLTLNDKTIGAISIYSKEADVFTEDEISLLSEVSNYLAHGITTIRLRNARELAEQELHRSKDNLEVLVDLRTYELLESNKSLNQEIDIRKKQEASLRAAEEKYRNVADFTSNWETWLAPDGKYIYVSPSCEAITGYTREEFMQDSTLFFRIAHADDRAFIENHYGEEIKNIHSQFSIDFRITTKEEQTVWIEHTCQPVFDSNGKWLGQRGSNRNITDRKLAESVLIESQKQLRALTQKVNEVAEEERIRIAREIHDELGHLLTAIKFDLESICTNPDLTSDELNTELESTIYMVEALIDTVRKISTELRPALLDHLGLLPAIDWLIMQFKSRTKITCVYEYKELNIEFDNNETTIIFRIVQEILTNIARHSKATQVTISIGIVENNFELTVTDNGNGFNMDQIYHSDSLGLMGMQERALSIGATLLIQSELKQGTSVIFMHRRI